MIDRDAITSLGRLGHYASALPTGADLRSLGEGGTPLLRLETLNRWVGMPNLWIKWEGTNPSGSFKDRLHAVGFSMARQFGFRRAFLGSTGNSGVAACAYGRRNGVDVSVRVHPLTPLESIERMKMLGGSVGPDIVGPEDSWPCTLLGPFCGRANPFGVEGYRTIAFETFAELGRVPDRFCVPVSGGDAIYGPWKGFSELFAWGMAGSVPRMTACQAAGADFAVRTLTLGLDRMAVVEPATDALSIADPTGSECIRSAVESSEGTAWSVDDSESAVAWSVLAQCGLLAEFASTVPIAALAKAVRMGQCDPEETVVAMVTSSYKKMRKRVA
ncbi:MAG: pyridoxal-phosphate dependent enzyme [Armatimonadaceae bacterium]